MEDECSIGNDETRCFILSSYATHKMNKVPCVLCNNQMIIFERCVADFVSFIFYPFIHVTDIRSLTGRSSSPPGSTRLPVYRSRRRAAPASCPRSAWPAWRAGPADSSAGTTTAPRSGTAHSSSSAPCTATTSSPRSPAVQRD